MSDEKVRVFDTTLRDGEQSPGVTVTPDQKVQIAVKLDELGVDAIEAGFPIVSVGEMRAIKEIANKGLKAEVCGLARATEADIDAAIKCDLKYVHTFIATSDIHMQYKLKMTPDQVLQRAVRAVEHAKKHGLAVEFSAEDATRSDRAFLLKVFRAVAEAGADRIDIPDTVGYRTPDYMAQIVKEVIETTKLPVSVHCHNDFGLAVANAISGINAGAACAHVTINGLGERAGNASLEEFVMTLVKLLTKKVVKKEADNPWLKRRKELISYYTENLKDYPREITAKKSLKKLRELLPAAGIVTTEVGQCQMWASLHFDVISPGTFFSSTGLGTMGFGFPASIGAKAARPNVPVVDIAGDGSFNMTENSLAVSVLEKLPVIVFLMNNYMLGMVAQWQRTFYNRRYSGVHQHSCPDYVKVAEAYGAQGIRAQSMAELEKAIKTAIKSDVATVIDIPIDPDEDVYPFVAPGTGLKDMITGA